MANVKQYYDIKFPFTANNLTGFFIDLNKKIEDKKASEILHVLLTPKRTRIRKPDFGTDLIKYIFEGNDEKTWNDVKDEIINSISSYVSDVTLQNIEILSNEENAIYVDLIYSTTNSNNKELIVKL